MPPSNETAIEEAELKRIRELHRSADGLIRSIYEKKTAWSALPSANQQKLKCVYATVKEDPSAAYAWQRLLNHLGAKSELMRVEPVVPFLGPQAGNTALDALLQIALRHSEWRQPPETWRSSDLPPRRQFASLTRHLFSRFETPAFLDAAWFEGFTPEGRRHRDWFIHIGAGQNIRTADLPVRLTKKAAHLFLQAPEDLSIVGALRWGQVLSLGGDEYLAQAVAASRLGSLLPDEPFWASVIHFFVNNSRMDVARVGPIVDFIGCHRFSERAMRRPDKPFDPSEAQEPEFTMKGRTLEALQKRVDEWHEFLAKDAKRSGLSWEPTGIEPFQAEERDPHGGVNAWTIVELLSSRALQEEGCEMRNCVRTYADVCQRGVSSVWSLRIRPRNEMRTRRLLTIEVNNARRAVVQVRGRCNQTLGQMQGSSRMRLAGEMVRRWTKEQCLSIACSL